MNDELRYTTPKLKPRFESGSSGHRVAKIKRLSNPGCRVQVVDSSEDLLHGNGGLLLRVEMTTQVFEEMKSFELPFTSFKLLEANSSL